MKNMTGYKLHIADEGRYPLETILEIIDLNTQKRIWDLKDVKSVLGPIYTVGEFDTFNPKSKLKKVPNILQSRAFEEKVLPLIIDDKVRFIDITLDGCNIKFFTRNPKFYMYEFYLNFSQNLPVIIPIPT